MHDHQWADVALPPAVAADGLALPHRQAVCVPEPPQKTGHAIADRLPAIAEADARAAAAVADSFALELLRLH